MSECTAEIAAGDQIAQRMNDFHDKVTATFSDLEQHIIHKFDIRTQLDGEMRIGSRRLWFLGLVRAVLVGIACGLAGAYLG